MGRQRAVWNEVEIIPVQLLARGSVVRGRSDLRGALPNVAAQIIVKIGRTGTTAISSGVLLNYGALVDNGQAGDPWIDPRPADYATLTTALGSTAAAVQTTVASDAAAGQNTVTVTSAAGMAAGDIITLADGDGGVTRVEWHRISKIAGGVLSLVGNLRYTHTAAQADKVANKADVLFNANPQSAVVGALNELVLDYGAQSTGESVIVHAYGRFATFNVGQY